MIRRLAGHLVRRAAGFGIVVLAKAYDLMTKTRPRAVRRLAGSPAAQGARETAEQQVRCVIGAYDSLPSLTLRLVVIEDACTGGGGWSLNSQDVYRVSCALHATAYFTASRDMGVVLEEVLTAGGEVGPLIAFDRSSRPVVSAGVPRLHGTGQTLYWDTPTRLLGEVELGSRKSDPPVHRRVIEGDYMSLAALRCTYGGIVRLVISPGRYFRIE